MRIWGAFRDAAAVNEQDLYHHLTDIRLNFAAPHLAGQVVVWKDAVVERPFSPVRVSAEDPILRSRGKMAVSTASLRAVTRMTGKSGRISGLRGILVLAHGEDFGKLSS